MPGPSGAARAPGGRVLAKWAVRAPARLGLPPGATRAVSYYSAGAERVALRVEDAASNNVYYLLSDHLGSTSAIADASGNLVARQGYLPYGGQRYIQAADPNAYTALDFFPPKSARDLRPASGGSRAMLELVAPAIKEGGPERVEGRRPMGQSAA